MLIRRAAAPLAAMAIALGVLSPVAAHHSFAPYETTLQMKLSGVGTAFKWVNPRVYIDRVVVDATTGEKSHWLIECASRRQKWIDMGQSLNLYIAQPSGRKLSDMYLLAWEKGLKTTYYLRSLAATQIEKSTTDVNRRGLQPKWMKNKSASAEVNVHRESTIDEKTACSLEAMRNGGTCEACQ